MVSHRCFVLGQVRDPLLRGLERFVTLRPYVEPLHERFQKRVLGHSVLAQQLLHAHVEFRHVAQR